MSVQCLVLIIQTENCEVRTIQGRDGIKNDLVGALAYCMSLCIVSTWLKGCFQELTIMTMAVKGADM